MKLAIMQPYFFPYIGYYQLIAASDVFIIYDNIKYTKKGWINRNRILRNESEAVFSIMLKKDSDSLNVDQREISESFDREGLLNQIRGSYAKAPYFKEIFPLLQKIISNQECNLFKYIYDSVIDVCNILNINTSIRISSEINIDHTLRSEDKVIAFCEALGARVYINSSGGMDLYDRSNFADHGIDLQFIKSTPFEYAQFQHSFVPWLSIIDLMMFNPLDVVRDRISTSYEMT